MSVSHLPASLSRLFYRFAAHLDCRSAARLPVLLLGMLLANGQRPATAWFRAAGIRHEFRCFYHTISAVGQRTDTMAISAWLAVEPCLAGSDRLVFAIDDTPTKRYGPHVQGAGIHHNPTPGPAGEKFVYGHIWVTLAAVAKHPQWGTHALPLRADLYVRAKDVPDLPAEHKVEFRTKLEIAGEQLKWLKPWVARKGRKLVVAVDGGYAKKVFLKAARSHDFTVISRLRRDAALWSLPPTTKRPGQRGPLPTYGKERISLAKRAGQDRGWQKLTCVQYGKVVTKTYKTFLATWRPAGGMIRVVLVREEHGWIPFFSTDPESTPTEVLEGAADRGSVEQTFKDVKEVEGAGQQQLRRMDANVGAFNLNLWQYSVVEVWAWERSAEELVNRGASPWDNTPRRPSHADKRKALQMEILRRETEAVLAELPNPESFRPVAEKLLERFASL
jgi:hypothetical protein